MLMISKVSLPMNQRILIKVQDQSEKGFFYNRIIFLPKEKKFLIT